MPNSRNHIRTSMKCRVKIWHDSFGELTVSTRDISEGGIFLLTEDIQMPPVGAVLTGQVVGLAGEAAPLVRLEIVRLEPSGVGLKFVSS